MNFLKILSQGYAVVKAIISGEDNVKKIISKYKEAKKDGKITLAEAIGIIDELIGFLGSIWSDFSSGD